MATPVAGRPRHNTNKFMRTKAKNIECFKEHLAYGSARQLVGLKNLLRPTYPNSGTKVPCLHHLLNRPHTQGSQGRLRQPQQKYIRKVEDTKCFVIKDKQAFLRYDFPKVCNYFLLHRVGRAADRTTSRTMAVLEMSLAVRRDATAVERARPGTFRETQRPLPHPWHPMLSMPAAPPGQAALAIWPNSVNEIYLH